MCGRFTLTANDRPALSLRFGVELGPGVEPLLGRYNVAPGQEILVVGTGENGGRAAAGARWGLVPAWAEDLKVGYRMINARSERVFESRAYGPLVRKASGRCLIPADGFYEWMEPSVKGGPRRPVRFTVDGGGPFSLAGLVTSREWEQGVLTSCTILTTEADRVVAPVHDRMPVLFNDPDSEERWLEGEISEAEVLELCQPFDPERISSRPASPALNKVGAAPEGPELLES